MSEFPKVARCFQQMYLNWGMILIISLKKGAFSWLKRPLPLRVDCFETNDGRMPTSFYSIVQFTALWMIPIHFPKVGIYRENAYNIYMMYLESTSLGVLLSNSFF